MQEEEESEKEQSCLDILVSSLVESVVHDEDVELDEDDRTFVINEILNVLEDHLDREGFDMLNAAFEKLENEYELQTKVDDIIKSLDWHENDPEE